jgi:integrase
MKTKFHRTKCTVKLKKSETNNGEYHLRIEAYPVFSDDSNTPKRVFTSLNRIITTPIWDKDRPTRGGAFQPKKNVEGIIQCRSDIDQEACNFAQKFCQMQQHDFDNRALYPELYKKQAKADQNAEKCFVDYVRELIQRRKHKVSENSTTQWNVVLSIIEQFTQNKPVRFGDLNLDWCEAFREYLMTAPLRYKKKIKIETKENKPTQLSPNTQRLYFALFKSALHSAYKDEILPTDLNVKVENIKGEETHRVYLTETELQQLADTPCEHDETRRSALFSAITGLRHSDIAKLTWREINDNETDPRIEFRQKKTKGVVYSYLSPEALQLCGKRATPESLVFPNLTAGHELKRIIDKWIKQAKITKNITFHCFRHTFATLQLAGGTDIYTVSKMLGHTDLKTTQIYAKVVDEKKQKATKAIKLKV